MNSENNMKTETEKYLPGKVSLAVAAVMSCLFTVGAVVYFCGHDLLTSAICFIAGSAVFSFFLVFVRHPAAVLVPVVSAAMCLLLKCQLIYVSTVCCAVTVFAVMYTICHMKLMSSFRQFFVTAIAYSVVGGGLFCLILDYVYGSIGGGIIAFGNKLVSMAPALAEMIESEGVDYETALTMLEDLLGEVNIYIPAVIFTLGIMCAWLMKGFFSMYTMISGIKSLFGGRQSTAPKSLAAFFLVVSFFGMFFSFLPEGIFYALSNIRSIISVIFIGEGVKLFFASFSIRAKRRASPVLFIAALILVFFIPVVIPIILPYYGAIGVLLSPREKKAEN